ncbi:MAG: CDP-glucose 4,6-dehydratase [Burkholderiales bacterium]|nr:CDP-glucose 4,6-dehydratase [Burkholderiales bacterium]
MVMNAAFWQGKRVLLTGHTGFKGAWLAVWLEKLGATVTGFALPPKTEPNLFVEANLAARMRSEFGNVCDFSRLDAAMRDANPEIIFHLAAQPLVRYSYADPLETFSTNIMGTANLLHSARALPDLAAVVVVTSDKCYQNNDEGRAFVESDHMGGHDPYSASKGCTELVTAAMRASFFNEGKAAIATVRAGNVIGGGDWSEDRLVPDLVRAASSGIPARIRNPSAIRPWQHVLEPLAGYLTLAERLHTEGHAFAEAWNFGPAPALDRSVEWVCAEAAQRWSGTALWVHDSSSQPREAKVLRLDSSKAIARLGWNSLLDHVETIEWTLDWYHAFHNGVPALDLVTRQIDEYQSRLTN